MPQTDLENGSPPNEQAQHVVYFDGACALCSLEIKHYASLDRSNRLCFVDVSDHTADPGEDLSLDAARSQFHIRLPDGTLLSGARAFIAVWHLVPGWRRIAPLTTFPGFPNFLEGVYLLFLSIRPALSRLVRLLGARAINPR